jgi:hypothetical protein
MKTIIAGSRRINDYTIVKEAIKESGFEITQVVSGGAQGPDKLGEQYAREFNISIFQFIPQWKKYGKKAGMLRNIDMGDYSEALVAIWDGKSNGTNHMIDYAKKKGLKVFVKIVEFKISEDWIKLSNVEILDPDGWNRKNFQFSWYEEEITKREFERRPMTSTINWN